MGFSLLRIGRKIEDILGSAADAVIPGNQSSWHPSSPRQPARPAANTNGAYPGEQLYQQVGAPRQPAPFKAAPNFWGTQTAKAPGVWDNANLATTAPPTPIKQVGTGVGLGAVRSLTGTGQLLTHGFDWLSPGHGTNRFSKKLDDFAKFTDQTAQNEGVGNGSYKTGQLLTEGLQLAGPAAARNIVKGGANLPKVVARALPRVKAPVLADEAGSVAVATAKPGLRIAEDIAPVKAAPAVSLRGVTATEAKEPNFLKKYFAPSADYVGGHGRGGQGISAGARSAREAAEIRTEQMVAKLPTVASLDKKEFRQFADSLDKLSAGKTVHTSQKVADALAEHRQAFPGIVKQARQAGLDVGDLGEFYFPRTYKGLYGSKKQYQKLAQSLVDSGDAQDIGGALKILDHMKRDYTRTYGNLEKSRLKNNFGYEKTHDAYFNYISRAMQRVSSAEHFGPKNERLNKLRALAQKEGYDIRKGSDFDKHLRIMLGDVDRNTTAHRISRNVRTVNAYRSLSTAGLSNATQSVNTATVAGVGRTLKAISKILTDKDARLAAKQSGVLLDHTINALAEQGLGVKGFTANIASPFFRTVEKFNRQVSATVGADWGNSLAKAASGGNAKAEAILRQKLGITGKIGAKLTRAQEIQAARKMTEISQFKVDPMDLPGWVDSPLGKLVAQFRTFTYKQTAFMYNEVLREATKGNFLPLTRFALVGAPAGALAAEGKGLIKGKVPFSGDSDATDIATTGLQQIGAGGIPGSEAANLIQANKYHDLPGATAGSVGGPTASIVAETAKNIQKANDQLDPNSRPLKKEAIRNVPLVGAAAANRVYPSKATAETDAYFGARDKAMKALKGDKNSLAAFQDYFAKSKDPKDGKTVQNSPAESLQNASKMATNDKLRKVTKTFETSQKSHDPMWDLSDDKLKTYMQYKAQLTGSAEKKFIAENNPWIEDIRDKSQKFFDGLKKDGKGGNSKPSPLSPKYPEFDKDTQSLLDIYDSLDAESKKSLVKDHPNLPEAWDKIAQWTNAMRRAEGAPELNDSAKASKEVQSYIDEYNALPKGDGPKGGNKTRSLWIQANGDKWGAMTHFYTQSSMQSLIKNASLAQFKGSVPNQKLLKAIYNLGQYDITKNDDGTYNLGGGGSGSSGSGFSRSRSAGSSGSSDGGNAFTSGSGAYKVPNAQVRKVPAGSPHITKSSKAKVGRKTAKPKVTKKKSKV